MTGAELVFEPVLPSAGVMALAIAAGALFALQLGWRTPPARRRVRVTTGAASVGAFLACLVVVLNPQWLEPLPGPEGAPRLTVLVDASRSMATRDAGGRTRLEAARELVDELARPGPGGAGGIDVDVVAFDRAARAIAADALASLRADGEATDLAAALAAARERRGAARHAVLLVSDGIHTAPVGTEALAREVRAARAAGVPVFAVARGGAVAVTDLAVDLEAPEEIAFTGQDVVLPVRVSYRGAGGVVARVTLEKDGAILDRREVALAPGAEQRLELPLTARAAGLHAYRVAVEPLAGETVRGNNARTALLRVIDDPVRVLVLEGHPYWDLGFLARALMRQSGLAVTTAVRLAQGRVAMRTFEWKAGAERRTRSEEARVTADPSLDALLRPGGLDRYQVVVLGRDAEPFLTRAGVAELKRWLSRRGGALLCARGRPTGGDAAELAALLPVRWEAATEARFRLELTREGREVKLVPDALADALPQALAGLATGSRVVRARAMATVLARAADAPELGDMPALTVQPYGLGRTLVLEGAGMWRTALLPAARARQESAYQAFWSGLIRWLVLSADFLPGRSVSLRAARPSFSTLEAALLFVRARGDVAYSAAKPPVVTLHRPGGDLTFAAAASSADPGLYRVTVPALPAGSYAADVPAPGGAVAACRFEVHPPVEEDLELGARPEMLERIARETGGALIADASARAVREACVRAWAAAHPARYRKRPAWDGPLALALPVALWALAWTLRRREGLV